MSPARAAACPPRAESSPAASRRGSSPSSHAGADGGELANYIVQYVAAREADDQWTPHLLRKEDYDLKLAAKIGCWCVVRPPRD